MIQGEKELHYVKYKSTCMKTLHPFYMYKIKKILVSVVKCCLMSPNWVV